MPMYFYQGRNSAGERIEGRSEAGSADTLASRLMADGIMPTSIEEQLAVVPDSRKSLQFFLRRKTALPDLIMFSRQMYSLTKAGVPIIRAIAGLAETSPNEELKKALLAVVDDLTSGIELAAAMGKQGHVFSALYVSMVHVGENTGRLDLAFDQVSKYLELELVTQQRIKQALRYPTFVLLAMVAALFVINLFVIPKFVPLFQSIKIELPLPTQILVFISNTFVAYWHIMVTGIAIGWGYFLYWKKTPGGLLKWDEAKLNFPIVGKIVYRALLARFARSFAMCQRAGVPISTSLAVVANAVDNAKVAVLVKKMREGVERGENISRTAFSTGMFSPLVLQMLVVGEETGQLDKLLDEVAEFYEREVDYDLSRLSQSIEPILIIVMGGMVLLVALGVFMPMWKVYASSMGH